jgi:hypothetical protein
MTDLSGDEEQEPPLSPSEIARATTSIQSRTPPTSDGSLSCTVEPPSAAADPVASLADAICGASPPPLSAAVATILELAPERRSEILGSPLRAEIARVYGADAPVIMASLLVGNTRYSWGQVVISKTYVSSFTGALGRIEEGQFPPIPAMTMMCFESVLYASYLGERMEGQALAAALVKIGSPKNWRSAAEKRRMEKVWLGLGYDKTQPHALPADLSALPGFDAPGRLIFFGPRDEAAGDPPQFVDKVPHHVGIMIGGGRFVGMPGLESRQQTCEEIARYVEDTRQIVSIGPPLDNVPSLFT